MKTMMMTLEQMIDSSLYALGSKILDPIKYTLLHNEMHSNLSVPDEHITNLAVVPNNTL